MNPKPETLIRRWNKKSKEYCFHTAKSQIAQNQFDANRYEGIATAFRWCAEDLKKALKK